MGVLQSSYDDVEHEMNVIREQHLSDFILFIAGDGLAITRVNHLLASKPELYLDSNPAMIPIQGVCLCVPDPAQTVGTPTTDNWNIFSNTHRRASAWPLSCHARRVQDAQTISHVVR